MELLQEGITQLEELEHWLTLQYIEDKTEENKKSIADNRIEIFQLKLKQETLNYNNEI